MSIVDLLNLTRFPDLARLGQGYVAVHQPEKGPFFYQIKVNDPPPPESVEKIVLFGLGAGPDLTRQLFRLCNGLWAADFAVYGLLSGPYGLQQPWDINVPNLYGRPKGMPEKFLIVGISTEKDGEGQARTLSHCIATDGRVVVLSPEKPELTLREYRSIDDWLQTEVSRALLASAVRL